MYNKWADNGGLVAANEVTIELDIEPKSIRRKVVSSKFSGKLRYALDEERHFALMKVCAFQPGLALYLPGQKLSPMQPSLRSPIAIKIP